MLFIVATPIGNLGDITLRALEVLKSSDYILCEDTRHSLKLLRHYEIQKPLKSYHKFNEKGRSEEILLDLKGGKKVALITDAGTPLISDPGEIIVKRCREMDIPVVPIPGPCAAICALTISGFSTECFQVVSFLPKTSGRLERALTNILAYPGTTVCYESPYRLAKTLKALTALEPTRQVRVVRELTKIHEECRGGMAEELADFYAKRSVKGEIVLLIEGKQA